MFRLGLIISVILSAYTYAIKGVSIENAFVHGSIFMYNFYWYVSIAIGVIFGTTFLVAKISGISFISLHGVEEGEESKVTKLFVIIALLIGMSLGGAYLLMTAGSYEMVFSSFDKGNLILGGTMIVFSIFIEIFTSIYWKKFNYD